jgi:hypothetical protein
MACHPAVSHDLLSKSRAGVPGTNGEPLFDEGSPPLRGGILPGTCAVRKYGVSRGAGRMTCCF